MTNSRLDAQGEYESADTLRCPQCLSEIDELWEFGSWPMEDGGYDVCCPYCDREFRMVLSVSVTYTSPKPTEASTRDEWVDGFRAFVSGHGGFCTVEEVVHGGPSDLVRIRADDEVWSGRWCDDDGTPYDFRQAAHLWLVGSSRWYL